MAEGEERYKVEQATEPFDVGNEFATVRVRKVLTRNGERLEISSARRGSLIRLDPLELESISWQSHGRLSEFLEEPYGPSGEV